MIKIGILGYGNLGRGAEKALAGAPDMRLSVVFSRRGDLNIRTAGVKVEPFEKLDDYTGKLDVVICCGGSATDLPLHTPLIAAKFNFVDSFDNHANIPAHFEKVDKIARSHGMAGVISAGWDPGLFSIMRLFGEAFLPFGADYTFWGRGVSQGHSDAIRRIEGVARAVQYTMPSQIAIEAALSGNQPQFTSREKHTRLCFVVIKDGADKERIRQEIITMPDYFAPYDVIVNFISVEEFEGSHLGIPHGGRVIRSGGTSESNNHTMEFKLKLDSNPEFTGSILVACARAVYRLKAEGMVGARTVLDIPPAYFSPKSAAQLYKELL